MWTNIQRRLNQALKKPQPHYAVFDADGTLWPHDAGETFFKYQLKNCNLRNLPPSPWDYYWKLKDTDAAASCLLLAQINKGFSLKQVRTWADECYDGIDFPIHKSMYDLVHLLMKMKIQVYIVTASIKWAVEPMARRLGLENKNVLGIEVTEKNSMLTDEGIFPLPYGAGKPEAFLKFSNDVRPIFGAGNTISDSYLVDCATDVQLAISSAAPGEHGHETEMKMREKALSKGWLTHSFY